MSISVTVRSVGVNPDPTLYRYKGKLYKYDELVAAVWSDNPHLLDDDISDFVDSRCEACAGETEVWVNES